MKEAIIAHMQESCPWQDSVLYYDTIDSTNTQAKLLATQGAPEGTLLIAGAQTGGRGRQGRSFHSPAGMGVYLSLILRPKCPPEALMHLTCAAAVALSDAVQAVAGFRPGIKWTNDLVHGGKKLAGILTELGITAAGQVDYAVIGIGINCCQSPGDFPEELRQMAGSLASAAGRPIDRAQVAAAIADGLYRMNRGLLTQKEEMLDRYRRNCITLGRPVSVLGADGSVDHGTAVDMDAEGALVLRLADGSLRTVHSGEVSVRGMYGYL